MLIWLGISGVLAAIILIGPLRWAMAIAAFTTPMAATMVFALGAEPVTLPLVTLAAFCARHAFTLVTQAQRDVFVALLNKELPLILLVGYCVVSGIMFPRLFAGQTYVPAQNFARDGVAMLNPGLVSLAQILFLALGAYVYLAMRQSILRVGPGPVLAGILLQAAFLGGMGFLQAVMGLAGLELPVDWLVNNTLYALLTTLEEQGFVRVTAGFTEASAWAGWAIGPLAFAYALFINRMAPRLALLLGAFLAGGLLLSTSSTAYVGLAGLALIALAHVVADPSQGRRLRALTVLTAGAMVFVVCAGAILAAEPGEGVLGDFRTMLEAATLRKQYSTSAIERAMWSDTAIQAGFDTLLLGAGFGTVRASGIIPTFFGSIGAPGLLLLAAFLASAMGALFMRPKTKADAVRFGAAFALAASLGPLIVAGAGMNMTSMIWIYAAVARTAWAPVGAAQTSAQVSPTGPDGAILEGALPHGART
jgi:hypothetical protein